MSNHTPPPWRATRARFRWHIAGPELTGPAFGDNLSRVPNEEREANIRLAEASPHLLAAAEKLLALMDSVEIDSRLGDETDRVFPRYEFEELRDAVRMAKERQE